MPPRVVVTAESILVVCRIGAVNVFEGVGVVKVEVYSLGQSLFGFSTRYGKLSNQFDQSDLWREKRCVSDLYAWMIGIAVQ